MSNFIIMFLDIREKETHKLVLRREILRIDDSEHALDELSSITGEIVNYVTIYEYDETSRKFKEGVLPFGKISLKMKGGRELVFNTINPIVKVEDLVVKLNTVYRERGLTLFTQKSGSARSVSYER
ncbi:MAG: hypothetical protein QXM54_01480 [Desulfurococcaceae archaeon]